MTIDIPLLTIDGFRSCPDIKQIYVLLREKRGKTAIERFKEMIDDEVRW